MSFFGFDTTMPRDRPQAGSAARGRNQYDNVGDQTADPFDPTNGAAGFDDHDDDALDAAFEEKLRGLRAAGREDLEIYTWGGGGDGQERNDGLGDLLDEAGDDFNEDTFGVDDVGRDFDFGTAGDQTSQQRHQGTQQAQARPSAAAQPSPWAMRAADPFASTMDDFWQMPDVAPKRPAQPQQVQQQAQPPASAMPSLLPQHDVFAPSTSQQPKTLEEIEAELRRQQQGSRQQPAQPVQEQAPAAPSEQRRQMTLEEVEAELRAQRSQQQQPQAQPSLPEAFPPLGSQPPLPAPPAQATPQPLPPVPGMPPPQDQSPQAQMARLRALLQALPNPIQARILALPPYMHFGATGTISRDFPALLVAANREKLPEQIENPMLWPRIDGGPEQQNAIRFMVDTALARIDDAYRMESKRQIRIAKIRAMSNRNNLMSRSDKDFITRIQVSQLITNDPYADDFYAHIYFALHGNNSRATVPPVPSDANGANKQVIEGSAPTATQDTGKKPRQRKQQQQQQQQHNRRDQAMLRMQQQMERIVQGRKERLEKAAGSAVLEGALGRVSLGSTKAPRQLLQINQTEDAAATGAAGTDNEDLGDDVVGSGLARDAVRQALKGASLAQGTSGQQRPALTKLEVLTILEGLYDSVLALEQSRRNAPSGATEDGQDEASVEWRSQREHLTNHVWSELRVLEPLEVSDPHPFISLMSTVKGKRLLPRVLRHLSSEQALTAMTMIVASFDKLDVVREAPLLDEASNSLGSAMRERQADAKRQSEAFVTSIVPSMYSVIAGVPLRIVSGMLALFIERNNPIRASQSKAGAAFLTIFLSRGATLRQAAAAAGKAAEAPGGVPDAGELAQWSGVFHLLIQRLAQPPSTLTTLFASTRAKARLPFGAPGLDAQRKAELEVEDRDVWQLMATIAVGSDMSQQQILVTGLRDKILENVLEAKQWSHANPAAASSGEGDLRIRNVNLLLHALNLDATQITV